VGLFIPFGGFISLEVGHYLGREEANDRAAYYQRVDAAAAATASSEAASVPAQPSPEISPAPATDAAEPIDAAEPQPATP
jgi:hypothetical protein